MKKILLTQGKFALVDDADYEWLNQWRWYALKDGTTLYVRRHFLIGNKQRTVMMHRQILGLNYKDGCHTDHRDGDGLNNQRVNIRVCTNHQNRFNQKIRKNTSSRFKGVHWDKSAKSWRCQIQHNRKRIYLGLFANEIKAAKAYDGAALKYFGEFARLNLKKSTE